MKLTPLNRFMKQARRFSATPDWRATTAAVQSAMRLAAAAGVPMAPLDRQRVRPDAIFGAGAAGGAADLQADAGTGHSGRFAAGTYRDSRGSRAYRLYIPPQADTRPLPLVVMLHGCTQDAADFAVGTGMNAAAEEQGFFVLYPEQDPQANPQRCWNWFKHSHQERGRGEPALLAGMVQEVCSGHAFDPARVYVAGLSAGGAMAAIVGNAYPELFAAVGVHSGLAVGVATDLPSALTAMRTGAGAAPGRAGVPLAAPAVPTIVFHGDADATVHPGNGNQVFDAVRRTTDAADGSDRAVQQPGKRAATVQTLRSSRGEVRAEHWIVRGAAHAWSGGSADGSFTDPRGPDATAEMLRFFFDHPQDPALPRAG